MKIALKVQFIKIENFNKTFYIYVGTNYKNTHGVKVYYLFKSICKYIFIHNYNQYFWMNCIIEAYKNTNSVKKNST